MMFDMNGKETNKFAYDMVEKDWQSVYFKLKNGPMIVYVKVKRKSVRYLEINHEDYKINLSTIENNLGTKEYT